MTLASISFQKQKDQRIQSDLELQLMWNPEIESKDISVKVDAACVSLTGFVHSYLEKLAAERTAKSVYGVLSIANDITVTPAKERTDPEIARDAVEALKLHSSVPVGKVTVTVRNGVVTLDGKLDWNFQRESAEHAVRAVSGVRGIVDLIQLAPTVSSSVVKEKIEDAWKRTIDLDARGMSVSSTDGSVSLYGSVHSWNERELAEHAAWQAPGVRKVDNHLVVTP